jgi:hypothetical protein
MPEDEILVHLINMKQRADDASDIHENNRTAFNPLSRTGQELNLIIMQ